MKGLDAIAGYEQELPEAALRQQRLVEEFLEEDDEDVPIIQKSKNKRAKIVEDDDDDYDYQDDDYQDDYEEEEPEPKRVKAKAPPRAAPALPPADPPTMEDALDALGSDPVMLSTDFGKFKLPAKCVMVNEFSIAFFLSEDSDLSLSMGACFSLEYKNKSYDVCYAGGIFTLNDKSKYKLLTFMQQL